MGLESLTLIEYSTGRGNRTPIVSPLPCLTTQLRRLLGLSRLGVSVPYSNKADLYANQIERWKRRKKQAIEYMGGGCSICGYNKSPNALEFHHIDPTTKRWNWNKLRLRKWKDIYEELDRCVLLCSNCHREQHDEALSN